MKKYYAVVYSHPSQKSKPASRALGYSESLDDASRRVIESTYPGTVEVEENDELVAKYYVSPCVGTPHHRQKLKKEEW
tara:strand:- start:174 stop:407 length:234 start_codon:yes stop_codon:yes gene_type:complete